MIKIKFKNRNQIRYSTAGDYFYDENGHLNFWITKQKNKQYQFLILMHEMIEQFLTEEDGIKEEDIMKWDLKFEDERSKGKHNEFEEPGDDPSSPYFHQHRFATKVEKMIADHMGIDWTKYNDDIIYQKVPKRINKKIGK